MIECPYGSLCFTRQRADIARRRAMSGYFPRDGNRPHAKTKTKKTQERCFRGSPPKGIVKGGIVHSAISRPRSWVCRGVPHARSFEL